MAAKIIAYNTNSVYGGPPRPGSIALLVEGIVVGLNTGGEICPADMRSATKVVARGFLLQSSGFSDTLGNTLSRIRRMSYTHEGKVGNLSGLTPGATYYLTSGGALQTTDPSSATGDIRQEVGYAESATVLVIKIGPQVVHA